MGWRAVDKNIDVPIQNNTTAPKQRGGRIQIKTRSEKLLARRCSVAVVCTMGLLRVISLALGLKSQIFQILIKTYKDVVSGRIPTVGI